MKQFLKILIVIIFFSNAALALEPASIQLSRIEKSLWGVEFKSQDEKTRLNRIERDIFGVENNQKVSTQSRIDKINETIGLEGSLDKIQEVAKQVDEIQSKGVSYPVISKMENKLFGKNYDGESIYERLNRLEMKTFKAKGTGDLNERTERLATKILIPESVAKKVNDNAQGNYLTYQDDENDFQYNQNDLYLQLSALEFSMFRKSFDNEPLAMRLSRMERKIFQRDFASDNDALRVQRIQAAASAKKTAKYYDGYKFQKYASTGLQVGTFILMILALIL